MLKSLNEKILDIRYNIEYIWLIISIGILLQIFVMAYLIVDMNLIDKNLIHNIFLVFKAKLGLVKMDDFENFRNAVRLQLLETLKLPFLFSLPVYIFAYIIHLFLKNKIKKDDVVLKGSKFLALSGFVKKLKKYRSYLRIGSFNKKRHILTLQDKQNLKLNKKEEVEFRKNQLLIPFEIKINTFFF